MQLFISLFKLDYEGLRILEVGKKWFVRMQKVSANGSVRSCEREVKVERLRYLEFALCRDSDISNNERAAMKRFVR